MLNLSIKYVQRGTAYTKMYQIMLTFKGGVQKSKYADQAYLAFHSQLSP